MDEAYTSIKYTLEKTEGSTKNGHSRDTGNIGHKTQNEDTTKKNTTQKTKKMSNTNLTNKPRVNPGALEGQAVSVSYKTPTVLLI